MPKLKLTKTSIDRVAKPSTGTVIYFDTETKGFGLRVTNSGAASFIVQGMVSGTSKEARLTVGAYGIFTVDQARDVAHEHLRTMRKGDDPRDLKKQDAAMKVTLQAVCDSYLSRPAKLKESTKIEMRRHVERVFCDWKDKPIAAITESGVRKRHRELLEGGLNGMKAAPASANASMVTLRTLINYASRQYKRSDGSPLIQRNPVEVLTDHWAPLGSRTERYIDKRKIGEVWNKLNEIRANPMNGDAGAGTDLTLLAILTGARRNELALLTWARVNIDDHDPSNCWWEITDRKRGEDLQMPLSSQAVMLLQARMPKPRENDDDPEPSPFVFPTRSKTGHIRDARASMEAVSKIVGKSLSLHDCRRSFSNYALRECGIEKFCLDLLTGHQPSSADVTARAYLDLTNLQWLLRDVQKIGDWIEQQAAIAASKNVVQLSQRA